MDKFKGKLIVIEGTDGSGKAEQTGRLIERLDDIGINAKILDFPQYGNPSAYFVEKYLNGAYGGLEEVGPYKASTFYSLDRFDVSFKIKDWLKQGYAVVSNRYTASNMGHQGSKLQGEEREKLIKWIYDYEYNILEIPKPDINFFLHVPAEISYELIEKKNDREYLMGKKRDIHEASLAHLEAAEDSYLTTLKLYPNDFVLIECVKNGKLMSIEEISEIIWEKLKNFLNL